MNFFRNRPLAVSFTFFIFASFMTVSLNETEKLTLAISFFTLSFIFFIISAILKRKNVCFSFLFSVAIMMISLALTMSYIRVDKQNTVLPNGDGLIHATVVDIINEGSHSVSYGVSVESFDNNQCDIDAALSLYRHSELKIGEKIEFYGSLRALSSKDNGFDERSYYLSKGYTVIAECESNADVISDGELSIAMKLALLRKSLANNIRGKIGGESSELMCALLLGERSMLSDSVTLSFSRCGISHILALSGTHLSVMCILVSFLLSNLNIRRSAKIVFIIAFVLFYTALTGAPSSVVRSAIMNITAHSAFILGRRYDSVTALNISAFIIIIANPFSVYDVGLILSYTATFGLLCANEFFPHSRQKSGFIKKYVKYSVIY